MIITVDRTGTVAGFKEILRQTVAEETVQGLLILAGEANDFSAESLDSTLQEVPLPLLGGIFPEIIYGQEKLSRGSIIAGLPVKPEVQVISGLSDETSEYDQQISHKFPDIGRAKTMIVLVDGLSKRISALIDGLFYIFGLELNYIGGGAGSLSFEQKPCLFTNEGLIQDAAVLALVELDSGVGVKHGWSSVDGPFKVTEVDRNVIKSLDWEPAFDVYRPVVERISGRLFNAANFFELAKGYPLGINKVGAEKIVRDPIAVTAAGDLVCVGEVPVESYVDILAGNISSLIEAAGDALDLSQQAFQRKSGKSAGSVRLFMDCISRVLFLEDDFERELETVFDQKTPLIGALTMGEIANSGKDYLEFYNKTAVLAILE